MLYLYAIIDKPDAGFELPRGLEDAELEVRPFEGLGAVVGRLNGMPLPDTANAHRHMNVLTALMQHCTVLPTRFGAVFRTKEQLARAVAGLLDRLVADLLRLHGHVELGMRVVDRSALILAPVREEGDAPAAEPEKRAGVIYITSKRMENVRRQRRARANEALADAVGAPFAELAAGRTWEPLPSNAGRPAITSAFLLARERLDAFNAVLDEFRRAEPKLNIVCTGPWPAYSFVDGGGHAFLERIPSGEVARRVAS